MPIVESVVDRSFTLSVPGAVYRYFDDVVAFSGTEQPRVHVQGDVVFVGHGIVAPELKWNDYAGVDVKGKWVMVMVNDPPAPPDEPTLFGGNALTYYGRWTYKYEEAARQGAAGAILIHTDESATYPWQVVQSSWTGTQYSLPPAAGAPALGIKAWMRNDAADDLVKRGGQDLDQLRAAAVKRGFKAGAAQHPRGRDAAAALGAQDVAERDRRSERAPTSSRRSSSPRTTITSACAIRGRATSPTPIASSTAPTTTPPAVPALLHDRAGDGARGVKPGRSMMFVFTTAEESGLLGAEYFAQHPAMPMEQVRRQHQRGRHQLSREDERHRAARRRSVDAWDRWRKRWRRSAAARSAPTSIPSAATSSAPITFPFAKAGVPALSISEPRDFVGPNAAELKKKQEAYNTTDYHQPSDEFNPSWDFSGAVDDMQLLAQLAWRIAAQQEMPRYNDGDQFANARKRRRPSLKDSSAGSESRSRDIEAAAARIRPAARVTPLLEVPWPGGDGNGRLLLKCENLQPMGAFKIRGAYNMLAQLPREELQRGVITYSSGNHGQAVALAARTLGAPAVIVMPTTAPKSQGRGRARLRRRGDLCRHDLARSASARRGDCRRAAPDHRAAVRSPDDHRGPGDRRPRDPRAVPRRGAVLVEVGGGGLSSGVSAAIKQRAPHVRVVGVEPEGAAKMKRSLEAGHAVTLDKTGSIADGLLTIRPGDLTFEHVRAFVDEVVTVPDEEMMRAIGWLFRHARLVVEPSGAVTVAALMRGLGGIDPVPRPGRRDRQRRQRRAGEVRTLHQPVMKDSSLSRVQLVARIREGLVQQSAPRVWLGAIMILAACGGFVSVCRFPAGRTRVDDAAVSTGGCRRIPHLSRPHPRLDRVAPPRTMVGQRVDRRRSGELHRREWRQSAFASGGTADVLRGRSERWRWRRNELVGLNSTGRSGRVVCRIRVLARCR